MEHGFIPPYGCVVRSTHLLVPGIPANAPGVAGHRSRGTEHQGREEC